MHRNDASSTNINLHDKKTEISNDCSVSQQAATTDQESVSLPGTHNVTDLVDFILACDPEVSAQLSLLAAHQLLARECTSHTRHSEASKCSDSSLRLLHRTES